MTRTLIILLSIFFSNGMFAQSPFFHTLYEKDSRKTEVTDTLSNDTTHTNDIHSFLASLSLEELEYLNNVYKSSASQSSKTEKHKGAASFKGGTVLNFYNGESHPLTAYNVYCVMEEAGISNKLFVLAQSLLETGYYTSNACKNYNNLFGLTNPRTGKLYQFDRWESSVVAYKKFVQYKYKGGNYLSFLKRIGYAEDPRYISKVIRISRQINRDMNFID